MYNLYSDPNGKKVLMEKKENALQVPVKATRDSSGVMSGDSTAHNATGGIEDSVALLKAKIGYLEKQLEKYKRNTQV